MDLQFTEQALDDLDRLRGCTDGSDASGNKRVSEQLSESIDRLRDQPELGHGVESLPGVREWIARNYVVHYIVLKDNLIVLQIWHGREDRPHVE